MFPRTAAIATILLLCLAVFLAQPLAAQSPVQADTGIQLIPLPVRVERDTGWFRVRGDTAITYGVRARDAAERLRDDLEAVTAKRLALVPAEAAGSPRAAGNAISLEIDGAARDLGPEGYRLEATAAGVRIVAPDPAGLFYGGRTLLQLLPLQRIIGRPRERIDWIVPCVRITDRPRFSWRGLMLDCSRTFQSLDYLRATIDRMAFYKLNVLHLHLTDDQGWRLEIRGHPELTAKGARFAEKYHEPEAHQGFYTQEEMAALIRYGSARHVTIVPEIEMPGHCLAALACRPDLSCTGGPFEIHPFFKGPGIHEDVFCAGNEAVYTFLREVLSEVIGLFPSEVIHLGGDEVPKTRWRACPRCRARMEAAGLRDEEALQGDFLRRMASFVRGKGRRVIGWDEIMRGGLPEDTLVMSWQGVKAGLAAARAGHDVVFCPTSRCYFDYSYERTPVAKVYAFEPVPEGFDPEAARHILGIQANFWSHIDRGPDGVDRQIYPRLLALAERAWSARAVRSFEDFSRRLEVHLLHLDEMGVHYHRDPPGAPAKTIGGWTPDEVSEAYRPLEWDLSGKITHEGRFRVRFQYTHGAHRLGIERVELLVNGEVVAGDEHRGVTGSVHERNDYFLAVPKKPPEGAHVVLRASARSEGGTDSNGVVYLFEEAGS